MNTRSMLFSVHVLMLAVFFTSPVGASAEEVTKSGTMTPSTPLKSADAASMSTGEVKKIDKDAGKITIKHGPLDNLGMPAMTMIFRVKDAAMLEQVRPGDTISFIAEKANGALTVIRMQLSE